MSAGFGSATGAWGLAKDLIKLWDDFEKQIHQERLTEDQAAQLKEFGLDDRSEDVKMNLELCRKILDDYGVSQERKGRLARDLEKLRTLLAELDSAVQAVLREAQPEEKKKTKNKVSRFQRYTGGSFMPARSAAHSPSPHQVLDQKLKSFDGALRELNTLIMTMRAVSADSNPLTDITLVERVRNISQSLVWARANYVPAGKTATGEAPVVLETGRYDEEKKEATDKRIKDLASRLCSALPANSIPRLLGYLPSNKKDCVDLVFEWPLPASVEPATLSALYVDEEQELSLNIRVSLCRQLAVAVLQTHKIGLVHKNIRPENLLVAVERASDDPASPIVNATLFLCGWSESRDRSRGASTRRGESAPGKLIYQHPDRHAQSLDAAHVDDIYDDNGGGGSGDVPGAETGVKPSQGSQGLAKQNYNIYHDIYSMGVCALELLMWDRLVPLAQAPSFSPVLSDAYMETYKKRWPVLLARGAGATPPGGGRTATPAANLFTKDSGRVKTTLEDMTKQYIPQKGGKKMAELVYRCLNSKPIVQPVNDVPASDEVISESIYQEIVEDLDKLLSAL
ncbi:hypothetical protein RB595_001393 [Gaeumannomyces hyphopodioides]